METETPDSHWITVPPPPRQSGVNNKMGDIHFINVLGKKSNNLSTVPWHDMCFPTYVNSLMFCSKRHFESHHVPFHSKSCQNRD